VFSVLGIAMVCLITTAPLLIAVIAAVVARDPHRRADARRIVRLLRPPNGGPRRGARARRGGTNSRR